MSADSIDAMFARTTERQVPRVEMGDVPGVEKPLPTPDEVRLADEVFAQHQQQESDTVAGMLGLWTGGLVLKDFIQDALTSSNDEEEEENKRRKEKKPDPSQ